MTKMLFKNYISPKGEEKIRAYKYKCATDSLVYTYLMGPLANLSLKFTPLSTAPNTLTFIGFIFNLIPYFMILSVAGEDMGNEISRWLCIFSGFSQFIYMNFDNMDGKQARRTNSSSALGMLYDHGLDSISGWVMATNLAFVIRLGNSQLSYFALIGIPILGFYFTTWEEYKLDFLNFGYINPVDEGLTLMNCMMIFTGIVGSNWWLEEGFFGFKRNECAMISIIIVCIFQMLDNVRKVYLKCRDLSETLDKLKISLFFVVCVAIVGCFSPSNISVLRTRSATACFGLGFSKIIGHIQLAHCSGEEFFQWRKSFIFSSLLLVANTLAGYFLGKCPVDEDIVLNIAIVINLISLVHYLLSMTQQLTRVLDIKVFSIKKLKQ